MDNEYTKGSVLAVVVTFNGGESIRDGIESLHAQVGSICVIDNGSELETLRILRAMSDRGLLDLHELGENRGIGYALNYALSQTSDKDFRWVLTMDQDSVPDSAMIARMLEYASENPTVWCLAPVRSSDNAKPDDEVSGPIRYAITSGNLVHVSVYAAAGNYNERYFIDCVDFEFSLRVRKKGFEIHRVAKAILIHDVGEPASVPQWGSRFYTNHSPVRRYYSFRNCILLARKYFYYDPLFVVKLLVGQLILLLLILIFERQKWSRFVMVFRGLRDGMVGRGGRYEVRSQT